LLLFVVDILLFDFNFPLECRDSLVTYFLLPVEIVQDLLSLIELALFLVLLFLLRLNFFVHLSDLSLEGFDLLVLLNLFIFHLLLVFILVILDGIYRVLIGVDFFASFIHQFTNKEFAVAKFADCAPQLVQTVLNITSWIKAFLL